MSLLTVEEIKTLVEQAGTVCISIYMPAYRLGAETQQNSVRFKNLIRQAQEQLAAIDFTETESGELLRSAMEALDNEDFWQHQDEGLAIFISENGFHYYRVPIRFEELVVVTDRFHLKPLLPLLTGDGRFYILSLSRHQIKLYEGSRYSVKEVEIEELPASLEAALQYDETAQDGQFRISTSKGGTANTAVQAGSFHGQGSPDRDDVKQDLLQYFHIIDAKLHDFFKTKRSPLVLAGVEYLHPLYREANTYQHLVTEGITGNSEAVRVTPEQLQAEAWQIVEPFFAQAQQAAIDHFHELVGTGKTSTEVKEAVPAAFYGRVEQLFVAVGVRQWGTFNPDANQIDLHAEPQPGDEDLLDAAAIQTLLNGGTVYAVEPGQVPEDAPLAAVFRY